MQEVFEQCDIMTWDAAACQPDNCCVKAGDFIVNDFQSFLTPSWNKLAADY